MEIKIENYPDDVYTAVGKITQAAQEWEQRFKELALRCRISAKKVQKYSLNKLNEAIKKKKIIDNKTFDDLKKVIDIRNEINHTFFLEKMHETEIYDSHSEKLEALQTYFNAAQYLIFEATDVICNKIDELNGIKIMRSTIFD